MKTVMRRTGKTTRLINSAIESLFQLGAIVVPTYEEIYIKKIPTIHSPILPACPPIVDEDWQCGFSTQENLFKGIIDRLNKEHNKQFDVYERFIWLKSSGLTVNNIKKVKKVNNGIQQEKSNGFSN